MRPGIDVLDVMRVPARGDASRAVRKVTRTGRIEDDRCDVLVVGGGTGGISAAIAAARQGAKVCLLEETAWVGGQMTAQGVSALDEHPFIEHAGGTRTYYELRKRIRSRYAGRSHRLVDGQPFNPGASWVTHLAFEPRVALGVLEAMAEAVGLGSRLVIHLRRKAVWADRDDAAVLSVTSVGLDSGVLLRHRFKYVIDATELGDLLPMTATDYVVGAESRAATGEPHGNPRGSVPDAVQGITYPAVVTRVASSRAPRLGPPPRGYEENRIGQPYSLRIHVTGGEVYGETTGWLQYSVFDTLPGTKGGLWSYRRLLDRDLLPDIPDDVTILNWPGNDYRASNLIDRPPSEQAVALQDAKAVSLGFLHWLRSSGSAGGEEAPGHRQIVPAPDVYGTSDGLSMFPYIRESRRIKALDTIREQDVSVAELPGPRAAAWPGSVGIGWYPIDIHKAHPDDVGVSTRTYPFQIPLGSLLPQAPSNLIAGAKNIGTTHITNGCYRLHPVEWNVGESAGLLAAHALTSGQAPHDIAQDPRLRRAFQEALVRAGVPLFWYADVHPNDESFEALQLASMDGEVDASSSLHSCQLPGATRQRFGLPASCNASEASAATVQSPSAG